MDWTNVTKIHTPSRLSNANSPPDEHALYKDNFASGNGELVIAHMKTAAQDCYDCCSIDVGLRLLCTFRGVSRASDVARPV